jgi:hypothetical protein
MSSEISYRHTQVNTLMFVLTVLSSSAIAAAVMLRGDGDDLGGYLLIGLSAVWVLLTFGRLVIEIHDGALHWRFGFLPWPRWSLPLAEIKTLSPTQTTVAQGSGIRGAKRDRLYNVSLGGPALRIERQDGRVVTLGTPEPGRLASFVQARMPRRP